MDQELLSLSLNMVKVDLLLAWSLGGLHRDSDCPS